MATKEIDSSWVVQKYGGTSLGKLLDTISGTIVPGFLEKFRVAIVCSARSGTSKSKGTTSLLLECINHAMTPGAASMKKLDSIIDTIRDEHLHTLSSEIGGGDDEAKIRTGEGAATSIAEDCEQLREFLHAAQVSQSLSTLAWTVRLSKKT